MKNKIISWILLIIWLLIIFYLSSQPSNQSKELSESILNIIGSSFNINMLTHICKLLIRKLAHIIEYVILGMLILNLIKQYNKITNKTLVISIIICVIYAVSDELHQYFVPGRSAQLSDILLDSISSTIGVILYNYLTKIKKVIL